MSKKRSTRQSRFTVTGTGILLLLFSCEIAKGGTPQATKPSSTTQSSQSPGDLTQVSIESLMNMEVTSVSKKEQKLSQVAAAIFVITAEDIRHSGAMNIPDLLRMVPGMDVAQINSNTWAISARGFNFQFANKLLVLIDGRAVYTGLFGGVNWDTTSVVDAEGSNPGHQAQLRSHLELWRGFAWDASAYFVGRLPAQFVASYTRLDTQLTWRLRESVALRLVGQNLLKNHHVEFNDAFQSVNSSQVKRSAYARLTWQF